MALKVRFFLFDIIELMDGLGRGVYARCLLASYRSKRVTFSWKVEASESSDARRHAWMRGLSVLAESQRWYQRALEAWLVVGKSLDVPSWSMLERRGILNLPGEG